MSKDTRDLSFETSASTGAATQLLAHHLHANGAIKMILEHLLLFFLADISSCPSPPALLVCSGVNPL